MTDRQTMGFRPELYLDIENVCDIKEEGARLPPERTQLAERGKFVFNGAA